jgi:archaetidylinositol phosphate synthase
MLSTLKPVAEKSLQPVARVLKNVNPNLLTITGLFIPVLFFAAVVNGMYGWALLLLVLHAADMLDGMVARAQNRVTAFGGFLDSTIDRFADFTVIAAFAFAGLISWEITAPLLMLTYMISYIRSRTELAANNKLTASVGLIERTERFIFVFVGLALYAIWPITEFWGQNLVSLTFITLGILSLLTVIQRVAFAYQKLK